MISDKKLSMPSIDFPSQGVPDSVKDTEEYGLKIGQAIQHEWFYRGEGNSIARFYSQWDSFHKLRLYSRGEQSVAKYKRELAFDGDLSYMNLDWTPVPVIPKFVDIVVNGMSDRLFKPMAYAQDAMSQAKRSKYQDMVEGQMVAKPILEKISSSTGVNPFVMDPDDLPENDEELSLHMQLKYKPAIEIAEEEAISTVFEENHYQDIRKRIDYDIVTLGIGIAKHEFLPGEGVRLSYVDPANVVYSYTEDPHFRDCFYWGEIKRVPVTELYKIKPDLTKEDIDEISKYSQDWYDFHSVSSYYDDDIFMRDTVTIMYYNYKSTRKVVYKEKMLEGGAKRIKKKDDTFNPPEEMMEEGRFRKIEKTIDMWYEGVMVMGTNIVLKWQPAENMVRPKSTSQYALPNYIAVAPRMYKGVIESLVRRMIPFADLIQITHLKLQQVISRVIPDGVFIDADGINEVDLGEGQSYTPEDALKLYFQTGSVVGRSYTSDGDFNNGRVPIQELSKNSGGSKTQMLISNYNHYLEMIRTVTGLNEARDGSDPDPRSLVGLQKLAALNSNTATRHILDGGLYIYRTLAEAISLRVSDILKYADFADSFVNKIGKYNVSILNEIKDLYLHDFGIHIQISPDEEQRAKLEENINIALSKGDINLEDAIDVREIQNIKLANQLLKVKRKKKQEADQNAQMQMEAMRAQTNERSQMIAMQAAKVKAEHEALVKSQVKMTEGEEARKTMQFEAEMKLRLMQEEFMYNMKLKGIESDGILQRDKMKEDRKDDRVKIQSSNQSELINQRKNNLPPIKFESNEDSLDGFSLEEFSPR